jgi:hypothetical protein
MVAFRTPGPCFHFDDESHPDIDPDKYNISPNFKLGPVGLRPPEASYSYAISGIPGTLGSMLFSETNRVPGIWYDRTEGTNKLRGIEAALGASNYADKAFRKSSKITKQSTMSPSKVDVNIHFATKDRVESITVRGKRGIRSFRFDFDAEEAKLKNMSKNADVMKPFKDTIEKILSAVAEVR